MRTLLIALLFICSSTRAQVPGLPIVDFERYFPHMVAVSDEVKNAQWPRGVQWKFISVRDEKEKVVTLALVRREGHERIVRLLLAKGPQDKAEEGFRSLVSETAEEQGVKFDIADLRDVRSFAALKDRAGASGWGMQQLPNSVER
jgi:hypothetical protein